MINRSLLTPCKYFLLIGVIFLFCGWGNADASKDVSKNIISVDSINSLVPTDSLNTIISNASKIKFEHYYYTSDTLWKESKILDRDGRAICKFIFSTGVDVNRPMPLIYAKFIPTHRFIFSNKSMSCSIEISDELNLLKLFNAEGDVILYTRFDCIDIKKFTKQQFNEK